MSKHKTQTHKKNEHHVAHKATPKESKNTIGMWQVATFIFAGLLLIAIFTNGFNFAGDDKASTSSKSDSSTSNAASSTKTTAGTADKQEFSGTQARMEFYVMSQCPYGTQVEDAIKPVLDRLGGAVDFKVDFIANDNGDGTFKSLHGENEVLGNIAQLCAMEYEPDTWTDMIVCMNENAGQIPTNWQSCAADLDMDVSSIKNCYDGEEGKTLLRESIQRTSKVGATGSPTMYLNGQPYSGGRDTLSFMRAICNTLDGHPECDTLPACGTDADCTAQPTKIGKCVNPNEDNAQCDYLDPVAVKMTVINDKTCSTCDTSRILQITTQLFPGVTTTNMDYSDPAAKALLNEVGLKILPAYIFDANIVKTASYPQNANVFTKAGDKYYLQPSAVGATHNPDVPEVPKKLDLYVMSQCPYGSQAVQSMEEVLGLLGEQIDFKLWFIANENADGTFTSLHGPNEVAEDIRQVCVYDKYPDKAFQYILCVAKDYSNAPTVWEGCATSSGIDVAAIKTCSEGSEGKQLLSDNIKSGNELGIGSSPTFVINNRNRLGGAQPSDVIKTAVCQANTGLEGCATVLTQATAVPQAQGGGC